MLIKWCTNICFGGYSSTGTLEVADNMPNEEIELRVKDEFFKIFNLNWKRNESFGPENISWILRPKYNLDEGISEINGLIEDYDKSASDDELEKLAKDTAFTLIGGKWKKAEKESKKCIDADDLMFRINEAAFWGWPETKIVLFDQLKEIIEKSTF